MRFRRISLALLAILVASHLQHIVKAHASNVTVSKTIPLAELYATGEVLIDVPNDLSLSDDFDEYSVYLRMFPSGETFNAAPLKPSLSWSPSHNLIVRFRNHVVGSLLDSKVRIIVSAPQQVDRSLRIRQLNNQVVDAIERNATARIAYAKTSREKDLYASFGAGGGEMALNPTLYKGNVWKARDLVDQIEFALNYDRGTSITGDPDSLNVGFNFRKIFPMHRAAIQRKLSSVINSAQSTKISGPALDVSALDYQQTAESLTRTLHVVNTLEEKGEPFFRAVVLTPIAPRLETNSNGHRLGFLVNFVNNSDLQIRSGYKLVLGQKNQATINSPKAHQPMGTLSFALKLIPIGFESGVAVRNPDDIGRQGSPIFRVNTGIVSKFTYKFPCRVDLFVDRMEIELKGMNRHLLNDETAFNEITNRSDGLVRGNKYALQADLRFIFGVAIPIVHVKKRPAVTVSYKNGFFPPVYAFTNKVSVKFTLESRDDTSFDDLKVRMGATELLRAPVH